MARHLIATAFEMVLVVICTFCMTTLLRSEERRTSLVLLLQRNRICVFTDKGALGSFAILKENQSASLYFLWSIRI